MKFNEIKQLIKVVEKSDIDEIEIVEEGSKVRISKNTNPVGQPPVVTHNPNYTPPQQHSANENVLAVSPQPAPEKTSKAEESTDHLDKVTSPMVGTFYRSPAPDADPYVEVGDHVKTGQTLCIIEAMKLMNEIQSEHSGTIKKILVENAQPVEYEQILFLLEKD